MSDPISALLRSLPSVSRFMDTALGKELSGEFGEGIVKMELRSLLEKLRDEIRSKRRTSIPDSKTLSEILKGRLTRLSQPIGRTAINATGVLLHTGLGRAPLAQSALEALSPAAGYSILQVDQESGARSLREEKIERMLQELTGCEAATVVNNNAAATWIILQTLAEGREVIISRGQLVADYWLPASETGDISSFLAFHFQTITF